MRERCYIFFFFRLGYLGGVHGRGLDVMVDDLAMRVRLSDDGMRFLGFLLHVMIATRDKITIAISMIHLGLCPQTV
jgi:hypothetical protein